MSDRERPAVDSLAASSARALRLDAALLVILWLGSLAAWQSLPERFPIHFDLTGRPDAWTDHDARGLVLWLLLPALTTVLSLLMRWLPRAARRNPSLWNIPDKRRFLALDEEARKPAHAILAHSIAVLTPLTTSLMLLLQLELWASAQGARIHAGAILVVVPFYSVIAIVVAARAAGRAGEAIR